MTKDKVDFTWDRIRMPGGVELCIYVDDNFTIDLLPGILREIISALSLPIAERVISIRLDKSPKP